jgi:CspA family cold shock protein
VHADGASGRKGERVFPSEKLAKIASVPPASAASAQTSQEAIPEQTSLEGMPNTTATPEQDVKNDSAAEGFGLTEDTRENLVSAKGQEEMAEPTQKGETRLSAAPMKTLTLKGHGLEQGVVSQSFSHGRTKPVVVEKVKIRGTTAPAEDTTVKNPGTDPPTEDRAKDAITVFDCWQREWIPDTTTSFLTKGAGIVKIQGSEAFERANVIFSIAYCDGTTQTFPPFPFSYDGKRTKSVKERDRITGTVKWFDPDKGYGFIGSSTGEKDTFVHISAVEEAGFTTLYEGQTVEYELVTMRGKTSAGNLKVSLG